MKVMIALMVATLFGGILKLSSDSYGTSSGEEVIKNAQGRIVGYISGKKVYDKHRSLLGWSDSSGTYSKSGQKILMNDLPGVLLCGQL